MEKKKKSNRILILVLCFSVILLCAILGCSYYALKVSREKKVQRLHSTVSSQIQTVAELVTLKNVYSSVASVQKAYNGNVFKIAKISGVIRIGIPDIRSVNIQVSSDGKAVNVLLPHSAVLENALTSQELFSERNGIFVKVSTQELFDEINEAMEAQEEELIKSGALSDSDNQAAAILTNMLKACGFEKVTIRFQN